MFTGFTKAIRVFIASGVVLLGWRYAPDFFLGLLRLLGFDPIEVVVTAFACLGVVVVALVLLRRTSPFFDSLFKELILVLFTHGNAVFMVVYYVCGFVICYNLFQGEMEAALSSRSQYFYVFFLGYIALGIYAARWKRNQKPWLANVLMIAAVLFSLGALLWGWTAKGALEAIGAGVKDFNLSQSLPRRTKAPQIKRILMAGIPPVNSSKTQEYLMEYPINFGGWAAMPGLDCVPDNCYLIIENINHVEFKLDPKKWERWADVTGATWWGPVRTCKLDSRHKSRYPTQDAPIGALIAKLGDEVFQVGYKEGFAAKITRGGEIALALNEIFANAGGNASRQGENISLRVRLLFEKVSAGILDAKSAGFVTGIYITSGQTVRISANANWSNWPSRNGMFDPNGAPNDPMRSHARGGSRWGELEMRIGNGKWFRAGAEAEFTYQGSAGYAEFRMYDGEGKNRKDNVGTASVSVFVDGEDKADLWSP